MWTHNFKNVAHIWDWPFSAKRDNEFNEPNQAITNFSSYQLNDIEQSLLAKGLYLDLPPKILNRAECLLPFEMVYRDTKTIDVPSSDLDNIKVALKEYAYSSFK